MSASDNLIDAVGHAHQPAGSDPRIVCLVPSITELLCDLGLQRQLVGRTGFCIHPREVVRAIPKVGGTKDVDIDKVRKLKPTHVIVNVDENRKESVAEIATFGPTIVVTHPLAPQDNLHLYRMLGALFARETDAERWCREYARVDAQIGLAECRPARRVLYLIWRKPWMTVNRDTYISRTLARFNWQTVPADAAVRYPEIALGTFAGRVDHVLLSTEPYAFQTRHVAEVRELFAAADVRLLDGEMTSWYGSRAIAGLRYLDDYTRKASNQVAA
ncbi:MAG: helical backbone metal receptor [Gammaproteobacteria bacterium]